jgi:hypothetical protein
MAAAGALFIWAATSADRTALMTGAEGTGTERIGTTGTETGQIGTIGTEGTETEPTRTDTTGTEETWIEGTWRDGTWRDATWAIGIRRVASASLRENRRAPTGNGTLKGRSNH